MNNFNTDNVQGLVSEENVELLKVMAHPVRLQIVSELAKSKTLNVTQLTDILDIPQSTVSQHLSKMRGKLLKLKEKG